MIRAARAWLTSHGAPTLAPGIALCWLASAAACHLGLPRVAPGVEPVSVDLQLFGVVLLAMTGGVTTLLLLDACPWLAGLAARRGWLLRLAWIALILVGTLLCAGLALWALPAGVPRYSGFLALGVLWWALGVLATVAAGRLPGLVVPLALVVISMLRVIPWRLNLVFHPALSVARVVSAAVAASIAVAAYAMFGAAVDRRSV